MTELTAQRKFIDTGPIKTLFTQGEHLADTIRITIPCVYDETDISDCTFAIRTVSYNGSMTETILTKEIAGESIVLTWKVSREATASAGMLYLQLIGSKDEAVIIKFIMPPVIVGESVMGDNVPVPDVVDEKLAAMNELLVKFAEMTADPNYSPQEVQTARTGSIVENTFPTLSARLSADFKQCITQGELESALSAVTTAYSKADKALAERLDALEAAVENMSGISLVFSANPLSLPTTENTLETETGTVSSFTSLADVEAESEV